MDIKKISKSLTLNNLKWWEDPYTFACVELSCLLNTKLVWKNSTFKSIDDVFPQSTIIKRNMFYKASYYYIKVDEYLIIVCIDKEIHIMYNPEFKSEDYINNLIEKIVEEF